MTQSQAIFFLFLSYTYSQLKNQHDRLDYYQASEKKCSIMSYTYKLANTVFFVLSRN